MNFINSSECARRAYLNMQSATTLMQLCLLWLKDWNTTSDTFILDYDYILIDRVLRYPLL